MEQGADKHSARLDDQLKHATEGMVRAGRSTRAEEWRDPEPSGEDEPDVDRAPGVTLTGGTPDGMTATDVELRSELASYLDRSTFPAVRAQLMEQATENNAPERVLDEIRRLPDGREYVNVNDIWSTLGGGTEQHRF